MGFIFQNSRKALTGAYLFFGNDMQLNQNKNNLTSYVRSHWNDSQSNDYSIIWNSQKEGDETFFSLLAFFLISLDLDQKNIELLQQHFPGHL